MSSIIGKLARSSRLVMPMVARSSARQIVPKRNGGDVTWHYRNQAPCTDKKVLLKAEVLMAFMWYWVLHHTYYNWGDFVGHHEYPDPSKWTDAELGIPADEED